MIYIVGSTKNKFIKTDFHKPFFVDAEHKEDNIDNMNPWYCELTGLYHMWKNEKDDIVGLEHYRRYFIGKDNKVISEQETRDILKDNDIILRRFIFKNYGQRDGFWWLEKDDVMKYFIEFLYQLNEPEFAMYTLHQLETVPEFAQCNMFIGKKEVVDKYCEWLFGHLEKLDFDKFKNYPRIMGYMTEFIFYSWLTYHKYKTTWQPTISFLQDLSRLIEVTPGNDDSTTV